MAYRGPYTRIAPDEIFTDRQEFLDRWFKRILGTPRLTMPSRAITGRRRMGKTKDPLLRDYLEGLVQVSRFGETWVRVRQGLFHRYKRLLGSYSNAVGLLGEAYLELLMRRFDDRNVEGRYFGVEGMVRLPRFKARVLTRQRFRSAEGEAEIDLMGVTGVVEWWCVESKNSARRWRRGR